MYYVNRDLIHSKLQLYPLIDQTCREIERAWNESQAIYSFAQERVLFVALESVTDVGSLMIDGFLMRDASSYEDIVDILRDENVLPASLAGQLLELVQLRKELVLGYGTFPRNECHPLIPVLPKMLADFSAAVQRYLVKELDE